jgi:diguanylate cyclase (GGDEF)-like protein
MPPRGLQSRLLALLLLLVVGVQIGGFALINTVGGTAARNAIGQDLLAGARVFDRLAEEDAQRVLQGARALASDAAFRQAIATNDRARIHAALAQHGRRIDADLAMLVSLDQRIVADTLDHDYGERFPHSWLIAQAVERERAAAIVVVKGRLYQLVVVPVLAPARIGWVAVGVELDDSYAQDLRGLTRLDVSFLSRQRDDAWALQASTLPEAARLPLLADISAKTFASTDADGNAMLGEEAVTRIVPLHASGRDHVLAVLQQPLASAMEPFRRLQLLLAWTSLLAVAVSVIAGLLIARGIARPVRELAAAARRIAAGDYAVVPPHAKAQEIADLATAFQTMQRGIASREARIMDLAYRDALTGLPNRTLYCDRLAREVGSPNEGGRSIAVLLMDLDHFKYVNDALGHPIGDLLLREVAERLRRLVRNDRDLVARLGGDEFALLLPATDAAEARAMAAAVLSALEAPMTPDDQIVDVRASIGIALFPDHGSEAATLLRHADIAMYAAKRAGGGTIVYDPRHEAHSRERLSLMSDLRKAVDDDELTLVYQPKIALGAASGHHVEALVRWRHPTRGIVSAAEFIPFAEQTGYIRRITQWVTSRAIAQCTAWRTEGLPMHVSINISARDVMDATLPETVAQLLAEHGCASRWISFEITESALLDDPGHAVANLERLHALGCRIAIDDYGTGYSSLAYLRRLPLSELKIDKSFVGGMARDADDAAIVRSTIDLAHDMRLAVVAEGVEDEGTLEQLRALGCDMAQGHLLSQPVGPLQIAAWVRESPWARAARDETALRRVV